MANSNSLYCVVVTDPGDVLGSLQSPIIFHVNTHSGAFAETIVKEELVSEDYGYSSEDVKGLDIFGFEVKSSEIIERF
jgi:hypothetical protein